MNRNDHPTMDGDLYVDADPGGGIPGTVLTASGMNPVQEELVNVVEAAGLVLDENDYTQVLTAVETLIGRRAPLRNKLLNGGMRVWQRGETFNFADAEAFSADRWAAQADGATGAGTAVVTRQDFASGQTTVPGFPDHFLRYTQQIGSTVTPPVVLQRIEGVAQVSAGVYTVSGWMKADAPITVALTLTQNFGPGGSADSPAGSSALNIGTGWTYFSRAFAVPTVSGKTINDGSYLEVAFVFPGAGATFIADIAQVQYELGNLASAFDVRPFGVELSLCQRYYEQSAPYGTLMSAAFERGASFGSDAGNQAQVIAQRFRVEKAVMPAMTWWSPNTSTPGKIFWDGSDRTVTANRQESTASTGYPEIGGSITGNTLVSGGWTAESEL